MSHNETSTQNARPRITTSSHLGPVGGENISATLPTEQIRQPKSQNMQHIMRQRCYHVSIDPLALNNVLYSDQTTTFAFPFSPFGFVSVSCGQSGGGATGTCVTIMKPAAMPTRKGAMNEQQRMVSEFMQAFGQKVPSTFTVRDFPGALRAELIREEAEEFAEAIREGHHIKALDALCDLLYVTYGAACAYGVDIEPLFAEVHRSNMSKLGADGKPIYREDGKVLKPGHWSAPDIMTALANQVGLYYLQQIHEASS